MCGRCGSTTGWSCHLPSLGKRGQLDEGANAFFNALVLLGWMATAVAQSTNPTLPGYVQDKSILGFDE
jgi:hypothetical protein